MTIGQFAVSLSFFSFLVFGILYVIRIVRPKAPVKFGVRGAVFLTLLLLIYVGYAFHLRTDVAPSTSELIAAGVLGAGALFFLLTKPPVFRIFSRQQPTRTGFGKWILLAIAFAIAFFVMMRLLKN